MIIVSIGTHRWGYKQRHLSGILLIGNGVDELVKDLFVGVLVSHLLGKLGNNVGTERVGINFGLLVEAWVHVLAIEIFLVAWIFLVL